MNEWDKLWENSPFSVHTNSRITEWAKKVKIEGDKLSTLNQLFENDYDVLVAINQTLREKADKWDELDSIEVQIERLAAYVNEDSGETIEIILEAVENQLNKICLLEQKLEAIKQVTDKFLNGEPTSLNIVREIIEACDALNDIRDILEESGAEKKESYQSV